MRLEVITLFKNPFRRLYGILQHVVRHVVPQLYLMVLINKQTIIMT